MRILVSAALALAALSACGTARDAEQASASVESCTWCHEIPPTSGAHVAHRLPGVAPSIGCETCHVLPETPDHANGRADVVLSAFARQGVTDAGYDRVEKTCATYCHGSSAELGDGLAQPRTSPPWYLTGGLGCDGCHAIAPTSGAHLVHIMGGSPLACSTCHAGYSVSPTPAVHGGNHVNGTLEASVDGTTTYTSWPNCVDCHT